MRGLLLRILEATGRLLWCLGMDRLLISRRPNALRVLVYHSVSPAADDSPVNEANVLDPEAFSRQLGYLASRYHIVDLRQLLVTGDLPPRPLLITFDDGYASVYRHARPALRREKLPATVFLVTDVIGNDRSIWIDELDRVWQEDRGLVSRRLREALQAPASISDRELRDRAILELAPTRISSLLAELGHAVPRDEPAHLSWDQVRQLASEGFTFGSHTATHPNLLNLSRTEAFRELSASRELLLARLGYCQAFAYPFGHHDRTTRRLAIEAGYSIVMEVWGSNSPLRLDRVARVPVRSASISKLFSQMEVAGPLKAWLRNQTERLRAAVRRAASGPV